MKQVYLDHAAATPLDDRVLAAMRPYVTTAFYNPSATYLAARQVAAAIKEARGQVAHWLCVRGPEIIFTAGGTEANNLAIHGLMRQFPDGNIVVSAIEHDSVLVPAGNYERRVAPVLPDGRVDLQALDKLIDDRTVLVSVMYANNEIGTVQPLREVAKLINAKREQRKAAGLPLYFHTDACQAAAYLNLQVARLGVDLMTINAGKIYGPKQCGALYVRTGVRLEPQVLGGGQELNRRSGTENVAGIIGLAAALELVQDRREAESKRLTELQARFIADLERAIPSVIINGSRNFRLPNNVHLTIPGADNEQLLMSLDEQGILAAAGSACSASKEQASHVLTALGKSDPEAYASLRFTFGISTTATDLRRVVRTLASLIK